MKYYYIPFGFIGRGYGGGRGGALKGYGYLVKVGKRGGSISSIASEKRLNKFFDRMGQVAQAAQKAETQVKQVVDEAGTYPKKTFGNLEKLTAAAAKATKKLEEAAPVEDMDFDKPQELTKEKHNLLKSIASVPVKAVKAIAKGTSKGLDKVTEFADHWNQNLPGALLTNTALSIMPPEISIPVRGAMAALPVASSLLKGKNPFKDKRARQGMLDMTLVGAEKWMAPVGTSTTNNNVDSNGMEQFIKPEKGKKLTFSEIGQNAGITLRNGLRNWAGITQGLYGDMKNHLGRLKNNITNSNAFKTIRSKLSANGYGGGRLIRRGSRRLKKGSIEAKLYMARLRAMRGNKKKTKNGGFLKGYAYQTVLKAIRAARKPYKKKGRKTVVPYDLEVQIPDKKGVKYKHKYGDIQKILTPTANMINYRRDHRKEWEERFANRKPRIWKRMSEERYKKLIKKQYEQRIAKLLDKRAEKTLAEKWKINRRKPWIKEYRRETLKNAVKLLRHGNRKEQLKHFAEFLKRRHNKISKNMTEDYIINDWGVEPPGSPVV